MMSLFSSFDYYVYLFYPVSVIFFMNLILCSIYPFNYLTIILFEISTFFINFFTSLGYNFHLFKSHFILYISIFLFVFYMNYVSVLSFNFASTSHVSTVLCMSFTVWLSSLIFNVAKNFGGFLSHLVPTGTPMYLVFFMLMIEFVSMIIRPLTLMIRLVSNILSGHLLMILLSNLVFSYSYVILLYLLLNLVEMFVSLIQAYIFSTLLVLYLSDSI